MTDASKNFREVTLTSGIKTIADLAESFTKCRQNFEVETDILALAAYDLANIDGDVPTAAILVRFEREVKRLAAEIAACRLVLIKRAIEGEKMTQIGGGDDD